MEHARQLARPRTRGIAANTTSRKENNVKISMMAVIVIVLTVATTTIAQQTNTLAAYRQSFEKQQQSILAQYGKNLDAVISTVKKSGDLDNILVLQAEKKRFDAERTVPAPRDAKVSFHLPSCAYYQSMVTLLGQYVKALDGMIKKEVAADRIEEAKVIKEENDKAAFLLADNQTKLPAKAMGEKLETDVPNKPASLPSASFKPRIYVDETRGWAGMEPNHNIYKFNVESVGRKTMFRFWASGDIGTATSGQVLLTGPDVQDQIIRQWQPNDFKIAANTVSSYKKLRPISCDVTSSVKHPGEYQFTFRWGGSQVGLSILRVELELQ
jgi:hypothetical protein